MSQIGDDQQPPAARHRRSFAVMSLFCLVVTGLVLILGLAPLSRVVADSLPQPPPEPVVPRINDQPRPNPSRVREVPVGLPAGVKIRTTDDVLPYVKAAFGSGAPAFMALLRSGVEGPVGYTFDHQPSSAEYPWYPYRYPALESVLDAAPSVRFTAGATALGAALTILGEGPAAYGVLDRARKSGACAPQLDLLLLVASDPLTTEAVLSQEEARTEMACPHDPTAGWLVGESQLRNLPLSPAMSGVSATVANIPKAITTFTRLAVEHPDDAGVIAGLADSYLRAGTHLLSSKPFTARQDLRSAVEQYNRVSALGDPRDAAVGIGRALIGLGEPADAARLLRQYAQSGAVPGPVLELLIQAEEFAHDFGAAEAAAKRLGRLGTSAYANGVAYFPDPDPLGNSISTLDDATLPLSFGNDRLTAYSAYLVSSGWGAADSALDLSFIPQYRDEEISIQPYCASKTWRRDAILNGHAAQALTAWPKDFISARPRLIFGPGSNYDCAYSMDVGVLQQIARTEAGQTLHDMADEVADERQNLLRWAGNLPAAHKLAENWQTAAGDDPTPALRLGEIDYLMHSYNEAAAEFTIAARRLRLVVPRNDLAVDQAELDRGAALLAAGRTTEGVQTLRPLDQLATQSFAYQRSHSELSLFDPGTIGFVAVSYFACEQLADYERESGDLHAAIEDYTTALSWSAEIERAARVRPKVLGNDAARLEVLNNNAALAYLGLGQTSTAATLEKKALELDGLDPTFLMTAGFIADRGGNLTQAVKYDHLTLQSDPGAFPAANDLAVELSREHHDQAALSALRRAVGANRRYALGWFNLGVIESKLGVRHVTASQGALAKAYRLDPSLKDRRHHLTIDASVYRTALDLSKPLPPRWSLAQLQRPAPAAAAGLLTVVVLGFGLAKASGRGGAAAAERWLDPISQRLDSFPLLAPFRHPAIAVTATAITFLLGHLRHGAGFSELVLYLVGVLVLAGAAMAARAMLARLHGSELQQSSWMPGIAFGLVTGALGLPWAPLPVIRDDDNNDPRLHLAAPLTLSVLSLALFVQSAWLHTPITQSWAVAALIMAASTLLPVTPLDGAHIGKTGIMTGAGVVGGALLVGLGLI